MSFLGTILKTAVGAGTGFLTGGPAGAAAGGISALTGSLAAGKAKSGTTQAVSAQNAGIQQLIDAAKAAQTQIGQTQAQSEARQIETANANRDFQYGLSAPTIAQGDDASADYSGFLNGNANGIAAFRANTGYQDLLNTGLSSVNANAYAKGAGDSGAALKALQDRATGIADRSAQSYLGNLLPLISAGQNARQLNATVGSNTVGQINGAISGAAGANSSAAMNTGNMIGQGAMIGADANSNAALINGNNQSNNISQLGALGLDALSKFTGSSFGGAGGAGGSGGIDLSSLKKLFGGSAGGTTSGWEINNLGSNPFAVSGNYNTTRLF